MVNTISREVPTFTELQAIKERLYPSRRSVVEFSEAQAMAYVWGRQDAGESGKDTGESIEFGRAYAMHEARYQADMIGCRHSIRDAFERWSKGQSIER